MRKRKVRYRLEVNYYSENYIDKACETSSPIYTKADGWKAYKKACSEMCIDKDVPARVHFWKYIPEDENGNYILTIAKNY